MIYVRSLGSKFEKKTIISFSFQIIQKFFDHKLTKVNTVKVDE